MAGRRGMDRCGRDAGNVPVCWIVTCCMFLVLMLAGPALMSASAQDAGVPFDIPAQPLSAALDAFAEQAHVQMLYKAEIVSGLQSMAVSGQFTPAQALQKLLQGTGLSVQSGGPNTLTVVMPAVGATSAVDPIAEEQLKTQKPIKVPEIVVKDVKQRDADTTSYVAEEASTATRTDTPLIQVPQSVSVITRKLLDDQKAIRVEQALRNVSGVSIGYSAQGRAANDSMFCRGFPCAFFKNNLRNDDSNQSFAFRDVANMQRLEVLKGPASVLYGRSQPGGVINILTKQPQADRYASIEQIVGSYNFYRTMVDVTGPMNESKTLLFRINGAYENTESFRDFVQGQRTFVAPVFAWTPGNNTTITIEGEYIRDRMTSDGGLPAIGRGIAPIPLTRFLGEPFDSTGVEEGRVSLRVAHRFNDNWKIESQFRADESTITGHFTNPNAVQANNQTLTRSLFDQLADTSSYYWRNDLIGKVATGSLKHNLLTGVELGRQSGSLNLASRPFGSINIYNPVYNQTLVPALTMARVATTFANSVGTYVQDQVEVFDNFHVLAGARGDYFYQHSTTPSGDTKAENVGFSPRIGLTYQPVKPVAFYANVTRSFQPTFGPFAAVNNLYIPSTGTQYEAGMKTDLVPGRLTSTLAIYRILRRNVLTANPVSGVLPLQIQTGGQRSQGIEYDLTAQLTPAWKVIATYAYTDARVTADTAITVGNRLPLIARNTGSLWTTYDFQEGLLTGFGVGAGLYIVDERAGDINNSFELPGYVRTDAALYYRKQEIFAHTNLVAQLNVQNLLDQNYYVGGFQGRGSAAFPGAPLTFYGSVKLEFN